MVEADDQIGLVTTAVIGTTQGHSRRGGRRWGRTLGYVSGIVGPPTATLSRLATSR